MQGGECAVNGGRVMARMGEVGEVEKGKRETGRGFGLSGRVAL